jgi:hypothetical protein
MRNTIKKILKEDMDWIGGVQTALPNNKILDELVPVTISLREYLNTQYGYNFIDIILKDDRVIELTMEGDYDVRYDTYSNVVEIVKTQGISNPWQEEGIPTEIDQSVIESYLREFSMEEVTPKVDEVLRKLIPLDIKGIYVGSL